MKVSPTFPTIIPIPRANTSRVTAAGNKRTNAPRVFGGSELELEVTKLTEFKKATVKPFPVARSSIVATNITSTRFIEKRINERATLCSALL